MFTVDCTIKKTPQITLMDTERLKSRRCSEKTRGKTTKIRAFLLSPHNKSTYFPKLSNTSWCQRKNHKCHTGSKLTAAKASGRRNRLSSLERESTLCVCLRVDSAFMCWQTLPCFHCYRPVQTITHWAERRQREPGVTGRRLHDQMWSCVLQ